MVKEDESYEIPIESLGLSVKAINELKRLGCEFVGDCVDGLVRSINPMRVSGFSPNLLKKLK